MQGVGSKGHETGGGLGGGGTELVGSLISAQLFIHCSLTFDYLPIHHCYLCLYTTMIIKFCLLVSVYIFSSV